MGRALGVLSALLVVFAALFNGNAEGRRNAQAGEIELEETGEKKRNIRGLAREDALSWAKSYSESAGSGASVQAPSEHAALYLAACYLYCVSHVGNCAFLLDSILETDVMALRQGGSGCPSMTKFWRAWLDNDMETRLRHDVPIGLANEVSAFNARERPKYLKCGPLLEQRSKEAGRSEVVRKGAQKTLGFLNELDFKSVNVFAEVGINPDATGETAKKAGKKSK
jgi:hypothetical protein